MPNVVKYSTTAENNAIKKGNMAIGVNSVDYGGGGQSGWWNTIDVPTGGYVVYVNKASNGPSIMVPPNDTALVGAARSFGASVSVTTAAGALNYFASQSDMMVVNKNYNNIVTSGLVLNVDASFVASYPLSGTSWYDISGSGFTGTLTNGPTFNSGGWIVFDGLDDYVSVNSPQLLNPGSNSFTVECLINQKDTGPNGIIEARGSNLHGFLWLLNYNITGRVLFALNTTSDAGQNFYASTVNTFGNVNQWMYLSTVVNRSNETLIFYKNGVKQGNTVSITSSGTTDPGSSYRYWIGADLGGDESNSNISVTRQYNRILSESEILQNYYGAPIVTNGLILSYDGGNLVSYDTTGTTIYDLSVSAYSGTLTNGPTYSVSGGGSILYDGVDDYITLPSSLSSLSGTSGASLSMWIKLDSGSNPSGQSGIIQLSSFTGSNGNLYYYTDASNVGGIWLDIFRTNRVTTGDWQPTFNGTIWHNLTVTCQSGTTGWKMYLNQNLAYQTSGPSVVSVDSSLFGGFRLGQNSGGRDLKGRVAICNIYNRVLSSSEVLQNFNAHRNRFGL